MLTISRPVGKGAYNPNREEVRGVQKLLNKHRPIPLRVIDEDGDVGTETIGAIEEFQSRVLKMRRPDGRVDPGGATLAALNADEHAPYVPPVPPASEIGAPGTTRVTFQHGDKIPTATTGVTATATTNYESTVSVAGKTFRGSIYPDDMNVKGRLKDGEYELHVGFHKRKNADGDLVTPTASDLVARTQGFRAALIVNLDQSVPVTSNNANKTTSSAIHVHNGFTNSRGSDGCLTLHPSDWEGFINLFLAAYPTLNDWTSTNAYVGKKVGVVEIKA